MFALFAASTQAVALTDFSVKMLLFLTLGLVHLSAIQGTDAPVVAILTQEFLADYKWYQMNRTFIAGTYVKFIESSGARVVPLLADQNDDYYAWILNQVNGVLLPGGDQDIANSSYTRAVKTVYRHAIRSTDRGIYFPVWAICQGLEVLSYHIEGENPLQQCTASDFGTPLRFSRTLPQLHRTKMFRNLTYEQYQEMMSQTVLFQWHHFCLSEEKFSRSPNLQKVFRVLATNSDTQGQSYVSVMESRKYPIYAVIFHPEEVMFNFLTKADHSAMPHSAAAVRTAQYFANFFVHECRKNHNFMDTDSIHSNIIYNFAPEHMTDSLEPYDQIYFFLKSDYEPMPRPENRSDN